MIILSPRFIGSDINLDKIQFFADYCNSSILSGRYTSTAYLPTFKLIALGMQVEITDVSDPRDVKIHDATLNASEKAYIEKLYTPQGWVCSFTTRTQLAALMDKANDESRDILLKLLYLFKEDYEGDIFYLSTFAFKERDLEAERIKALRQSELLRQQHHNTLQRICDEGVERDGIID